MTPMALMRSVSGDAEDLAGFFVGELVVEGIFAADEGDAVGEGGVAAGFAGADERAHREFVIDAGPAEIVEDGDAIGIGADGDDVADGFVDGGDGHFVGVFDLRGPGRSRWRRRGGW